MCAHVERDMTNLIFTRDLFDRGLENGLEGARVVVGNQVRGGFAFVPVGNNVGQSWSSDGRDEG